MQLIKHVHIFAPQDLGIQDILISEGHIAHIAPHIETAPYMEITGSGKQLTPGLIDRHVHVSGGGEKAALRQGRRKSSYPLSYRQVSPRWLVYLGLTV